MLHVAATAPFAPSLVFINSSVHVDSFGQIKFSFKIKPDVSVYAKNTKRRGPTDVARAELLIEFKWNASDDPFCNPYTLSDSNNHQSFLRQGKACSDTLGQITLYAAAQLGS